MISKEQNSDMSTQERKLVAFIPMKDTSEGCPGKLFEIVGDVPMFVRTVRDAVQYVKPDKIVLLLNGHSSEFHGLIMRLIKDHASFITGKDGATWSDIPTIDVLFHQPDSSTGIAVEMETAIKEYKLKDYAWILLQPTSPFRDPDYLMATSKDLRKGKTYVHMTINQFKMVGIKVDRYRETDVCSYEYQGDRQSASRWFCQWDGNVLANSIRNEEEGRVYGLLDVLQGSADNTIGAENTYVYTEGFPYNMQVDSVRDMENVTKIAQALSL